MTKEQLDFYNNYYFVNDTPVPFELIENSYIVRIKPIKTAMYQQYVDNVGILMINKNKISDPRIISMSYLQYLIDELFPQGEQGKIYQQMLHTILSLSLGEEYNYTLGHDDNNRPYLGLYQNGEYLSRITPKEFNQIVEIILYYNDEDYDGRYISDDLQKAMMDYNNIKFKDQVIPNIESKKCYVMAKNGMTLQQINEMSYRHFLMLYNHCVNIDIYFGDRILQASEKYKLDNVIYPLFKKKPSKFDFLQDKGELEHKIAQVNG